MRGNPSGKFASAAPSAATIHGVHQLTGTIRVFDNGRIHDARPMAPVTLQFPGLGSARTWTMGHPEAITLPRAFPGLERCLVVMTMPPAHLAAMRVIRRLVDAGMLSLETAASWIERLEGVGRHAARTPADYLRELAVERSRALPPLFAVAHGQRDGAPAWVAATLTSAPTTGMGGATGVPLAVGVAAARDILGKRTGVFAPEAVLDPTTFLDLLAPLCTPARRSAAELLIVTESWQPADLRADLARLMRQDAAAGTNPA